MCVCVVTGVICLFCKRFAAEWLTCDIDLFVLGENSCIVFSHSGT